jgi:hypothetical protein
MERIIDTLIATLLPGNLADALPVHSGLPIRPPTPGGDEGRRG